MVSRICVLHYSGLSCRTNLDILSSDSHVSCVIRLVAQGGLCTFGVFYSLIRWDLVLCQQRCWLRLPVFLSLLLLRGLGGA